MRYTCLNGKFFDEQLPVLMADNRGYRYGDGLFETIKVVNEKILLKEFHFERLFNGCHLLKFQLPALLTPELLCSDVLQLCKKNNCQKIARVRLSVFRGNGGLIEGDRALQYVIECWPLIEAFNQLNENGLVIGIFPDAKKSCDIFSSLKSANFLPYNMAAQYSRDQKWNDAIVLNQYDRVADASIANIFIIHQNEAITPPLSEGSVSGVMRRYLLEQLNKAGYAVKEKPLSLEDLQLADELFLTNAIYGIRWVKQCGNKSYTNTMTATIFDQLVKTIWR